MDNIVKLIDDLAKEGHAARLVVQIKGRQWLASVVDPCFVGKETVLCDRAGDRFLTTTRPTAQEALAALDKLCI